jgi:hypothetical protein
MTTGMPRVWAITVPEGIVASTLNRVELIHRGPPATAKRLQLVGGLDDLMCGDVYRGEASTRQPEPLISSSFTD